VGPRPPHAEEIAAARRTLGINEGSISVGTITRLMPSKGNTHLIAATPEILRRHPRTRIFIIGEGELGPELAAQAHALALGERLVFPGFTRDVAAALSALDIVVFPSLWEGTPLTVFEALGMGKPIVSTDADGLLDVLTDRHDALVVPKANPSRLADAVCELIDNPSLASRLAAAARATGAHYDIGAFVTKMERLYELLCAMPRATRHAGILQADLSFLEAAR
jgi:glycosyltransferase involved in cell wall biosynthesis